MSEVTDFKGRGIQEADVFAAADALLAEGKRPTIERVRLKVGRGSPNTVSPMLEKWFATLSDRLVGSAATPTAGNDPEGMPPGVRNAARLLWETARREAEEVQRGELESVRADLQLRETTLAEAQAALVQREEAFGQARTSLDAALASSQQARETLERQLREHAIEAIRVRHEFQEEIQRLTALLSQAAETQERLRHEHAQALAARDQDLRQAEERHAGQERRMLGEVDRARQTAKALELELAKEQQRRSRSEEAATTRLEAALEKLRQVEGAARSAEATLREKISELSIDVAQVRTEIDAAHQQQEVLQQRVAEERAAHDATRRLLAQALAARQKASSAPASKRARRSRGIG
jgi:hypothetical protein